MAKTRTFIGISPTEEIAESAQRAIARLARYSEGVKWVERANLHWTLHFLGEIDDQEVYEVCQAAERGAAAIAAFGLKAVGIGAFPSTTRPRILWIGAAEGGDDMTGLHAAIETELKPLGFRSENRRFVPHLTLGRAGRGMRSADIAALAEQLAKMREFEAGSQPVDEVTVYASRLRREGPEYQVLARVPLG